jgi:uncharacterized protein YfiM (DUF2279 family)
MPDSKLIRYAVRVRPAAGVPVVRLVVKAATAAAARAAALLKLPTGQVLRVRRARPTAMALAKRAVATLPDKTELAYVDYRDELDNADLAKLLAGDEQSVFERIAEAYDESRDSGIEYLLGEALNKRQAARVRDNSDAWLHFSGECLERDESDPLGDLIDNSNRKMIRFKLRPVRGGNGGGYCGDPAYIGNGYAMPEDSWSWSDARVTREARKLALAAGIPYAANREPLRDLVNNATYGGLLHVLAYVEFSDVWKAVSWVLRDDGSRARITFTDPTLLLLDSLNGSGFDAEVSGQVVIEFGKSDLGEVMALDHKGAGTGYSWSDDIAGVSYSAFKADPKIELLPPAGQVAA